MIRLRKILRYSAVLAAVTAAFFLAAASASAGPLAFTANDNTNSVSAFDTATNKVVGEPIPVGDGPYSLAVAPNGRRAYVANVIDGTVDAIDIASLKVIGKPIVVGKDPSVIAIAPNGRTAYVTDSGSDEVSVINLQNNSVTSVPGIESPYGIAVDPDGESVWVASSVRDEVSVIDPTTLKVVGTPIPVGEEPISVAFTPDGKVAYTADFESEEVSAIDTATHKVNPIGVGADPWGLGVTPDGSRLFVSNYGGDSVSVIDTGTNLVTDEVPVGDEPYEFGMAPNGRVVYLAEFGSEEVIAIDTRTDQPTGSSVAFPGGGPWQVVVTPDQSPTAAFTPPGGPATVPTTFSGAASTDPDGSVVSWNWAFGDGGTGTGVTTTHAYGSPGTYEAKLNVVDNEGCGEAEIFTGRTASCSGGASSTTHPIAVSTPPAAPIAAPAPSNKFKFGRLVHNTRNGTARLQVKLPAAGSIILAGPKVHMVRKRIGAAGSLWLTIHARVELNKQLKKIHRKAVKVRITFTPTGGTAKTTHRSITLLHRAKKK